MCWQKMAGSIHNLQTLRIVDLLERKYAAFGGLNLTWHMLEGLAKHNGPIVTKPSLLPAILRRIDADYGLDFESQPSGEAQIAALSDDIAYNTHDIDDGLRAGFFCLSDLADMPLLGEMSKEISRQYPALAPDRQRHELIRHLINHMVKDVIATAQSRVVQYAPANGGELCQLPQPLIAFSDQMRAIEQQIRKFLHQKLYHHPHLVEKMKQAKKIIVDLFEFYQENPDQIPHQQFDQGNDFLMIADYIAGMTDRYAMGPAS